MVATTKTTEQTARWDRGAKVKSQRAWRRRTEGERLTCKGRLAAAAKEFEATPRRSRSWAAVHDPLWPSAPRGPNFLPIGLGLDRRWAGPFSPKGRGIHRQGN